MKMGKGTWYIEPMNRQNEPIISAFEPFIDILSQILKKMSQLLDMMSQFGKSQNYINQLDVNFSRVSASIKTL